MENKENGPVEAAVVTESVELDLAEPGQTALPVDDTTTGVQLKDPPPIVYKSFTSAKDLRAFIFQKKDIKEQLIQIPEWEVELLIRGLTGQQRALTMKASMGADGQPNLEKMYAHMVVYGVHHPITREPVFKMADMDAIMKEKSGGVIERIAMMVTSLSGLDQSSAQTIEKN